MDQFEGIPGQLRIVISIAVDGLKKGTAPTSLGYNDMAIMIAYGQSREFGIPEVHADMISKFLLKHPSVPSDSRMQPDVVQGYLETLAESAIIEELPRG